MPLTKVLGLFKKLPSAVFLVKLTQIPPLQHQDGIKKKPREKGSFQEAIVTTGGSRLVSPKKTAYSDFL